MDIARHLHWLDYIVLGLVLFLTVGIGVYFAITGNRQRTTSEYFTGNRKLGFTSTILSISVTFLSGIGMIGIPSEVYLYGGQYVLNVIAVVLGPSLAALLVLPVLYPLKLVSVNKYIEMRYKSKLFKLICTFHCIFGTMFYMAVVTYVPAVVLSVFTGWPIWIIIIVVSMVALLSLRLEA